MPYTPLKVRFENLQVHAWTRPLRSNFAALNAMLTELFAGTGTGGSAELVITIPVTPHATQLVYNGFIARRAYTVLSVDAVVSLAQGGAVTATVVKATGTAAPVAATTPLHTGTANLNAAAHTVQALAISGTPGNLALAIGDRIGLVLSAALTTGIANVTIRLAKA